MHAKQILDFLRGEALLCAKQIDFIDKDPYKKYIADFHIETSICQTDRFHGETSTC